MFLGKIDVCLRGFLFHFRNAVNYMTAIETEYYPNNVCYIFNQRINLEEDLSNRISTYNPRRNTRTIPGKCNTLFYCGTVLGSWIVLRLSLPNRY